RTPSLSLRDAHDGKVLVHCHAGCNQQQVIATLRACGLWPEGGKVSSSRTTRCTDVVRPAHQDEANRRREAALAIWLSAVQADGTLVSTYFASRGIHLSPPHAVRCHPGLKHPSGGVWPAMVALVTGGDDATPLGIHRTFLARDGTGKASLD